MQPKGILRDELTPEGDATHLLVTYRRINLETAHGCLPGVYAFQRFVEIRVEYPEWRDHASRTAE